MNLKNFSDFAAEAADSVWLDANRYYEAEGQHEMSETELCKRANPGFSPPHVSVCMHVLIVLSYLSVFILFHMN